MAIVTIYFKNWHKFNPRKDFKNPVWFAVSNRITEDDQIQTLTDKEFRAFIHLVCLASQNNKSGEAHVSLVKAERVTGISGKIFLQTIEKLSEYGICTRSVRDPNATLQYNTLQDITEQDTSEQSSSDFGEPEFEEPQKSDSLKKRLSREIQKSWLELYPGDFIEKEIKKAEAWLIANKQKAPKSNFDRFMNSWLAKGWESHRKTIPSSKPKASVDEIAERRIKEYEERQKVAGGGQ
jgi:hypothetical protein